MTIGLAGLFDDCKKFTLHIVDKFNNQTNAITSHDADVDANNNNENKNERMKE